MRVIVIVKGDEKYEAGAEPTEQEFIEMGAFNEELANAGVMISGEGLHNTSKGARIRYGGKQPEVTRGPFGKGPELMAGYWILEVDSLDEAIDWMKRAPFKEGEIEIRQIAQAEDFGEAYTPAVREQEERIRERIGSRG